MITIGILGFLTIILEEATPPPYPLLIVKASIVHERAMLTKFEERPCLGLMSFLGDGFGFRVFGLGLRV